jgi:hypothetical protein
LYLDNRLIDEGTPKRLQESFGPMKKGGKSLFADIKDRQDLLSSAMHGRESTAKRRNQPNSDS